MNPLAQAVQIPGYSSDVPNNILRNFAVKFTPNVTDFSLSRAVSRALPIAIMASGLFFFVKLVFSGFSYLTSAGDSAKIQAATKNLTNAGIGLVVVISAYFLAQIIQTVFGVNFI